MLNSRHIFIQQGSLTSNDNGRKKFHQSEIRQEDEQIMKWISHVNDRLLESAETPDNYLILKRNDCDILCQYTQLEHFSFKKKIIVDNISEIEAIQEYESDITNYIVSDCRDNVCFPERQGIKYTYLYDMPLEAVFTLNGEVPILPEIRDELRKKTLEKLKAVNEELETIGRNEKVVIYGGGYQTEAFLRYANINRLNIVGIVDRRCTSVFNMPSKPTTYENISDGDVVIVTPYYAANEIKKYLASLKLDSRVICLADICGDVLFTAHENIWAPDLDREKKGILPKIYEKKNLETVSEINKKSSYFVAVKKNRKYHSDIHFTGELLEFEKKTALVIQGPVIHNQEFTLNTLKLYHEYYPDMKLILSVWEDDWKNGEWESLDALNAEIVHVKRPKIRGYQNINLQLYTSYEGIKRAKESGCQYVFKTRSDMRFYSPDMLCLMYIYMKKFPLKMDTVQKERLVIFPPRYDYFYFISDFFMFGNVSDMLNYWDIEGSFSNEYVGESAETMLGIRYAEYIGERVKNNLENISEYDKVIKEYFAVVDDKMLDYIWYKYFYNKPWECEYHYNILNYVDWLEGQDYIV